MLPYPYSIPFLTTAHKEVSRILLNTLEQMSMHRNHLGFCAFRLGAQLGGNFQVDKVNNVAQSKVGVRGGNCMMEVTS